MYICISMSSSDAHRLHFYISVPRGICNSCLSMYQNAIINNIFRSCPKIKICIDSTSADTFNQIHGHNFQLRNDTTTHKTEATGYSQNLKNSVSRKPMTDNRAYCEKVGIPIGQIAQYKQLINKTIINDLKSASFVKSNKVVESNHLHYECADCFDFNLNEPNKLSSGGSLDKIQSDCDARLLSRKNSAHSSCRHKENYFCIYNIEGKCLHDIQNGNENISSRSDIGEDKPYSPSAYTDVTECKMKNTKNKLLNVRIIPVSKSVPCSGKVCLNHPKQTLPALCRVKPMSLNQSNFKRLCNTLPHSLMDVKKWAQCSTICLKKLPSLFKKSSPTITKLCPPFLCDQSINCKQSGFNSSNLRHCDHVNVDPIKSDFVKRQVHTISHNSLSNEYYIKLRHKIHNTTPVTNNYSCDLSSSTPTTDTRKSDGIHLNYPSQIDSINEYRCHCSYCNGPHTMSSPNACGTYKLNLNLPVATKSNKQVSTYPMLFVAQACSKQNRECDKLHLQCSCQSVCQQVRHAQTNNNGAQSLLEGYDDNTCTIKVAVQMGGETQPNMCCSIPSCTHKYILQCTDQICQSVPNSCELYHPKATQLTVKCKSHFLME